MEGDQDMKYRIYLGYIASFLITIMIMTGLRLVATGILAFAQATTLNPQLTFTCVDPNSVQGFISAMQVIVLVAIILEVVFVVLFNTIGFVSNLAMRIGEFFMERIRFVFELLIVYILFLWNLDPAQIIRTDPSGRCAQVDWTTLFNVGPIFFRLVGYLVHALGLA